MNKICIIISFNERNYINGLNLTKEWIDYRIDIFMKYTMKNLMKQTSQDFTVIIKYQEGTKDLIDESLRRYPPLSNQYTFAKKSELNGIITSQLQEKDYDYLIMTYIDSDDMYHYQYLEKLKNYHPKADVRYLINQKGYIFDSVNHRLGHWLCKFPTFFALVYKVSDYSQGIRYKIDGRKIGTGDKQYEILDENNFMITVHQANTATHFDDLRLLKGIIENQEIVENIINEFI